MEVTKLPPGPQGPKFMGITLTAELILKVAGLLVTATLLYANMNNNTERLGIQIEVKANLIETKMESFNWRLQQVERKIDEQERRDFNRLRQAAQP